MIKLKAKENFTLKEFSKIKNLKRANANFNEEGRLQKNDEFEASEDLARYLLNETKNPINRAVVDLVEIVPEVKEKVKEETKATAKKTTKKTIAKK